MSEDLSFTAETDIVAVGRRLMAAQLAVMEQYRAALLAEADVTAVHETRKAIRRTFTAFKLFRPFFQPESLKPYRRRLKKMMRYLGQARDTAVFREKLQAYQEASCETILACLAKYWQAQQEAIDKALRHYMENPKREKFWHTYQEFTQTPGMHVLPHPDPQAPRTAAHHIPVLIYQRVASLHGYADRLADASLERLHMLRIQGKELRYTLYFFAPVLGPEIASVEASLENMQDHLGALQDANIGLRLLRETVGCEAAVAHYRAVKEREITQLVATFPTIWNEVNSPIWQQKLATAMAVL